MRKLTPYHSLWAATFVSQTGAHLLTLALSAFLLSKTGSLLAATHVFVFSFLPGAIFSAHLGRLIDRKLSRKILVANDFLALVLSLLCGWVVATGKPFFVLCLLLSLRSISNFFGRAAVMKWVRVTAPTDALHAQTQFIYLSFFLSTTLSGMLATVALGAASIWPVVILDVATYLVSAGIFFFIDDKEVVLQRTSTVLPALRLHQYLLSLEEMLRNPRLFPIVMIFVVSAALFQGAYCILVNYLPLSFSAGRAGTGWFQTAASLGLLAGFAMNRVPKPAQWLKSSKHSALFFGLGVMGLFATTASSALSLSLLTFFVFHFFFEAVWIASAAELVALSPAERAGEYQFVATSTATLLMSIWALIFANITNLLGPLWASIGLVGFSIGLASLVYARFGVEVPKEVRVSV